MTQPGRPQEPKFPSPQAEAAAAKIRAALKASRVRARGRPIVGPSGMNRTETRYSGHLNLLRAAGEVADWKFEEFTLKLGVDTRYTPDFWVQLPDGMQAFHEVKARNAKTGGYLAKDDALVKLRIAAKHFPMFQFFIVWPDGGSGWTYKEIEP